MSRPRVLLADDHRMPADAVKKVLEPRCEVLGTVGDGRAMLVGIFQFQPSPFCILDKVAAPLDEANIGRFTSLVQEMSDQTQFIMITHSKKTMGIAPVMYGVTMQEPGVLRLLSVRFHDEPAKMTA
jgi:chromosome segregation protein